MAQVAEQRRTWIPNDSNPAPCKAFFIITFAPTPTQPDPWALKLRHNHLERNDFRFWVLIFFRLPSPWWIFHLLSSWCISRMWSKSTCSSLTGIEIVDANRFDLFAKNPDLENKKRAWSIIIHPWMGILTLTIKLMPHLSSRFSHSPDPEVLVNSLITSVPFGCLSWEP